MSDSNQSPSSKRPYATLDLKATEIKVTPIGGSALGQNSLKMEQDMPFAGPVPRPLPACAYALPATTGGGATRTAPDQPGVKTANQDATPTGSRPASTGSSSEPGKVRATISSVRGPVDTSDLSGPAHTTIITKRRGGFISHLATGIAGGLAALAAWHWGLPELTERGYLAALPPNGGDSTAISRRLDRLERSPAVDEVVTKLHNTETRLAEVEKAAAALTDIKETQSRFVAETKATLAAAASDQGAPDQIERLATLEAKLKAMSEAGANDPNAGRTEQLAAVTGKVAELETNMTNQLGEFRRSIAGDVDARIIAAAAAASEAAKSGTQRIDQELSVVKSDASRLEERLSTLKSEGDRASEALRKIEAELAALRASHEALTANVAKPSDIATAVNPVNAKLTELETNLHDVQEAEAERRANAERVVLSLELQNLKRALDRGQAYETELAEVEKAAGGKLDLTPLVKFKNQGVPTVADLNRNFRPSANAIIDAEAEPDDGSVVDRLIAGAKSVVRVRKVNHDAADKSAEAIAARMEGAMKEGRLADVIAEADELSPKAKEAAQPFLDKVSARATVDKAIASLEEQLKSSLSGDPTAPKATE